MRKLPEQMPAKRLVWDPRTGSFQANARSLHPGKTFIKGPLPLPWFETAAALPGKALHVALAVWFQVGLECRPTVKLGQALMGRFGISRDAKYDALHRLTAAGLVEVEQQPGHAPLVTVIQQATAGETGR